MSISAKLLFKAFLQVAAWVLLAFAGISFWWGGRALHEFAGIARAIAELAGIAIAAVSGTLAMLARGAADKLSDAENQ